ncbi:MAG: hypothetical protein ABFS56_02025 [Pseudomonadota bacterium]
MARQAIAERKNVNQWVTTKEVIKRS